ncbi:MAG: type IX secretion system membrane protein PorP/SprF [Crocinitomicaceae bacterium]|nr:type IX secretion system membrane protein PorP/SprF [Crocinitomicaceae bacterium]
MSNPSFSNIDLWLFELMEGNLSAKQIEQLELFLLQHPEFDVDRDVWEMAKMKAATPVFVGKEKMKRRVPIVWYSLAGTAALFFLVTISIQFWNNSLRLDTPNSRAELTTKKINEELSKLLDHLKQSEANLEEHFQSDILESINQNDSTANTELAGLGSGVKQYESPLMNKLQRTSRKYRELEVRKTPWSEINGLPLFAMNAIDINVVNSLDDYSARIVSLKDADSNDFVDSVRAKRSYGMEYGEYEMTFKVRMNKFSRALRRMMDNPVALKNYRDPHYHVPGMLPNDVSFSSTGALLKTRVQAISRLQWQNADNEQVLSQIAVDGYAYGVRGGLGVQINHGMYNDGAMNLASVALTYSPKISITKIVSLEPAVRFKMGNKSFDKLRMNDVSEVELDRGNVHQFYPGEATPIGNDLWYKDLGLSLMINTEWFFVGAQVDNIFRYRDNIYSNDISNPRRASNHFVGTLGTDWVSSDKKISLSPYIVYQNNENLSEAWLGANARFSWLTFGASVSTNLEPAASLGLKFKQFSIQYNADYTKSLMTSHQSLSHQVSLRFTAKPNRFGKRILNL